jgi:hypothetical protein
MRRLVKLAWNGSVRVRVVLNEGQIIILREVGSSLKELTKPILQGSRGYVSNSHVIKDPLICLY